MRRSAIRTLDDLPLYATDEEIAEAVVGPRRVDEFVKRMLPTLESDGFPKIDPFYGARPVTLVKAFYAAKVGLAGRAAVQDGQEDVAGWARSKRRA